MNARLDLRALAEIREEYRQHCATAKTVPLFSQAWLLDELAPDAWGAALVRNSAGAVIASWPYTYPQGVASMGVNNTQPIHALGPWFHLSPESNVPTAKSISRRHQLLGDLADQLPDFAHFSQNWNPDVGDWMPMHWRGFQQTTYYTYRVAIDDASQLWAA